MRLATTRWVVVSIVAMTGCVGANPDWDAPSTETISDAGALATGDGGTSDRGSGADPDSCLQSGSAWCERYGFRVCVDLQSDPDHCGGCFESCLLLGASCVDGQCVCPGPWEAPCDGACVPTRDNPFACGRDCTNCVARFGPWATCDKGSCEPGDGGGDDDDDD